MALGETAQRRRGIGEFVANLAYRAVIGTSLALPYRWRVPLAGWLVSRLVAPLAGYTKRIEDNLHYVMPELGAAEIKRLKRAVPDNAGRSLIETYSGAEFLARFRHVTPKGPGLDALDTAHREGRAVVLVTGHFGNYQAIRAALKPRGYEIGVLYREMNNGFFNDHYVRALSAIATPVFPRGRRGLSGMINHLRSGKMGGILIDQYMFDGADLTFFGKPAPTALSAMELALKYDALVVPVYGVRQANGLDFEVICEAPLPPTNAAEMTQALNDSLERIVRQHMDQWLWIHRRWKPENEENRRKLLKRLS